MNLTVSVDVDMDDILYSMSNYEMEKLLFELLIEMNYSSIKTTINRIKDENKKNICLGLINSDKGTLWQDSFNDNLRKLSENYFSLKKEEQDIIEEIAKKY